jgi:hypothetical protein
MLPAGLLVRRPLEPDPIEDDSHYIPSVSSHTGSLIEPMGGDIDADWRSRRGVCAHSVCGPEPSVYSNLTSNGRATALSRRIPAGLVPVVPP